MTNETLKRGARGGGVTLVTQIIKIVLQLVSMVVLSRLLAPEDFGLIAMVTVALALGDLLRDFGMPLATLQRRTLTHAQASNMFWVNTALGALAAVLLVLATPLLVALYGDERIGQIAPVLSLALLLNGLQVQLQVQLARAQRFVVLGGTDLATQASALLVAIVLAASGAGYWALVAQALCSPALLLITRAIAGRWLPGLPKRGIGTREMVRSGAHIGTAQLLTFAASNVDTVLIGARFGATSLGYYNRGFQLLSTPVNRMLGPLTQVVLPTFARGTTDSVAAHGLFLRLQFMLGFAGVWLFSASAAAAGPLVAVALGDQWAPTAPIFAILAVAGCFNVLSYVSYWVFLTGGHTRELLHYNLVTKPLAIALLVAGSFISLEAVAWAYAIGLAISWPINLLWLRRVAELPSARFFWSGVRLLIAGAAGFALTLPLDLWMNSTPAVLQLIVSLVVSSIGFFAVVLATKQGRVSLRAAFGMLRALRKRR